MHVKKFTGSRTSKIEISRSGTIPTQFIKEENKTHNRERLWKGDSRKR
jgi:hypothetical protein